MKQLRSYIRKILLELYEMTPQEKAEADEAGAVWGTSGRRALGRQYKQEIINDKAVLMTYQYKLRNSEDGKKLINKFLNGTDISIFHRIDYDGFATLQKKKDVNSFNKWEPFTNWIKAYAPNKRGKDMLSTIAIGKPLGTSFNPDAVSINSRVLNTLGFVMKGYPVFVSETDVMSQTLGSLPKGLVDHQKSSGIAKRAGELDYAIYDSDFKWAGEVLLDNWTIIGTYFNINRFSDDLSVYRIAKDSIDLGLPCYVYDDGEILTIIKTNDNLKEFVKKRFKTVNPFLFGE